MADVAIARRAETRPPAVRADLLLKQVIAGILFLAIWQLASVTHLVNPRVLPPVSAVVQTFLGMIAQPGFWRPIGITTLDAARGLALGTCVAVPLGLLLGMSPAAERTTRLVVDFGRSFPVVALLPVLILLFGANSKMKIVAISIACFFPVLIQSIYGARRIDPTIVDTILSYRIPLRLRFLRVVLPNALPFIFTGLRIGVTVAILVAVGVELVSLAPGIGREITLIRTDGSAEGAFVYIICAGLLGICSNLIVDLFEARLLRWHHRRGEA